MAPYQQQGAAAVSYPTSSLPLPKALRHNRSFACLANLLGLASTSDAESSLSDGRESAGKSKNGGPSGNEQNGHGEEDGEEDEDETGDVDEDSLLWDAQVSFGTFSGKSPPDFARLKRARGFQRWLVVILPLDMEWSLIYRPR